MGVSKVYLYKGRCGICTSYTSFKILCNEEWERRRKKEKKRKEVWGFLVAGPADWVYFVTTFFVALVIKIPFSVFHVTFYLSYQEMLPW